eukprot:s7206_g2.t1
MPCPRHRRRRRNRQHLAAVVSAQHRSRTVSGRVRPFVLTCFFRRLRPLKLFWGLKGFVAVLFVPARRAAVVLWSTSRG